MIQSMTGYGKAQRNLPDKKITVEIRSLNSKNLDINTRIPQVFREKEIEIRKILSKHLVRGKVDFSVYVESTEETPSAVINPGIVNSYLKQLREWKEESKDLLQIAMQLPDVMKTEREELSETEWTELEKGIAEAIEKLQTYRRDEGAVLRSDFENRIQDIRKKLSEVSEMDPDRIVAVREKLIKAIGEIDVEYDKNRFEQELIYYIEKLDITEEKVRLANHLDYFIKELDSPVSNGKKLAFISQEIGREINTIGSKANYAPMQNLVVQMKDHLEKIKEQMLNIL